MNIRDFFKKHKNLTNPKLLNASEIEQQNNELFYIKATNFTLCELLLLFIVLELTEI